MEQSRTATDDDAFFHSRAGCVQSIFDPGFLFFHFDFGCRADVDDGYAASQFRQTFLQLFFIEVRSGLFDLGADFFDPGGNRLGIAGAIHDGGLFFRNADFFGFAEIVQGNAVQLAADFLGDHGAAGQNGDILQHGFAAVAEARCFNRNGLERATQLVDDEGRQGFAFHVFGNDQQFFALLYHFFQYRQQVGNGADLPVGDQNVGVGEDGFHLVRIGDHIGRNVAAVELHAFGEFQFGQHGLCFFNGHDAVFADFVDGFGDQVADHFVGRGNGADLGDGSLIADFLGVFLNLFNESFNRFFDAAFQNHRIGAGRYVAQTFTNQSLGQNRRCGGAITGDIVGFGRDFFDQLGAHVFKRIFKFHIASYGHAVMSDQRSAVFLVENHIAAFRPESHFHRIGQRIYASFEGTAGFFIK